MKGDSESEIQSKSGAPDELELNDSRGPFRGILIGTEQAIQSDNDLVALTPNGQAIHVTGGAAVSEQAFPRFIRAARRSTTT